MSEPTMEQRLAALANEVSALRYVVAKHHGLDIPPTLEGTKIICKRLGALGDFDTRLSEARKEARASERERIGAEVRSLAEATNSDGLHTLATAIEDDEVGRLR